MAKKINFDPKKIHNWKDVKNSMAQENPDAALMLEAFRDQLMICLVRRLQVSNKVVMPISEVDDTHGLMLNLELDSNAKTFTFVLGQKQ